MSRSRSQGTEVTTVTGAFCSLSTKFEEVQYNIVMIGSKEEDIFFSFLTITEETTH